ncbi:MAG: C40 family peptidase [Mycolicibacterium sp.]|uniref:C40 family peptidase n=1 Tax=Mycolicibacterium sp. TaxID=2320850 RepID=UPI003D0BCBC6
MPSALVTALAAPIRRVQELVGPGRSADPGGDPASALGGVRDMLADVANSAQRAWHQTGPGWTGAGAEAAAEFAATTSAAIDAAADRAAGLSATVGHASDAVAGAHRRLQQIVDDFEARANALEPRLDSPGVAKELLTEARTALGKAISVVEELLAELDRHTAALESAGAAALDGRPAGTVPAGFSGTGSGGNAGLGGLGSPPAGWAGSGGADELAGFTREGVRESADESLFGDGLTVRLPDGTVVMAPNALAAGAVRHALTQLGVPYQWGGTSPDVGLDCSGLTQWAYREAGLDIPRLAQEQDIGAAVAPGALLPGDLAVWDGHVAMIVGDGTMIEAGDPVQLSPIRTTNAGQGFQGFWRPTG